MSGKIRRVYSGFVNVDKHPNDHEVVIATDSVAIFIYDRDAERVLLITQCRLPMVRPDNPEGLITETPAGRFDIKIGVAGLAVKEVKEEVGVTITEDEVQLLNNGVPLALSPGILTERIYVAYVEVSSSQIEKGERVFGVPEEGEEIRRVFVPLEKLESMVCDSITTWALVQWFLKERLIK